MEHNMEHQMNEYLQRQCPALAEATELKPQECDELLDESVKNPEKLFRIFWMLNALCAIKQISGKFVKKDFSNLLAY
jgi:hypothetical protein